MRQSAIEVRDGLKNVKRFLPHPGIVTRMANLELEKWYLSVVDLNKRDGKAKKIRQVSIRITDVCNLRCHTCGQWGDAGFLHGQNLKELKRNEVSPGRYLELFADLLGRGHRPLVYFWGGEPMLYNGIHNLIKGAADLGMPPSIATNGTNIAQSAEELVAAPLFLMQISVDGHNEETHNLARPAAGGGNNFRDIIRGIDEVRKFRAERGTSLPVIVTLTTISRNNLTHLVDIYEAFRHRADHMVFYLSWWIDQERAAAHEEDFERRFGFTPAKHRGWIGEWKTDDVPALAEQFRQLKALSKAWNAPAVTIIPPITSQQDLETYYTDHKALFGFDECVSIYQAVEINSNGDLSPCRDYHDYVVGNVKDRTISELWNSEPYRQFRSSLTKEGLMPVCSRCCGLMGY